MKNLNFFESKKAWSRFKDNILNNYLEPYISKIRTTNKLLTIIDCFAGKGKFDDGEPGSPLIIMDKIHQRIEKIRFPEISGIFIEKKYYSELLNNVKSYKNCEVWNGTFEDNLSKILKLDSDQNIFIYVDPYGICSLDFDRFKKISEHKFRTLEILLNFNSVGFLREGFRIFKCKEDIFKDFEDLNYEKEENPNSELLDKIANGNYWKDIILNYRNGLIDFWQAEKYLSNQYGEKYNKIFKHMVNIPIYDSKTKQLKYRLYFGTNHDDGILLMCDIMNRISKKIHEEIQKGQLALFEYSLTSPLPKNDEEIDNYIFSILKNIKHSISIKNLGVNLIKYFDIKYSLTEYCKVLKRLESSGKIKCKRDPGYTKLGKISTFMDFYKKIEISNNQ